MMVWFNARPFKPLRRCLNLSYCFPSIVGSSVVQTTPSRPARLSDHLSGHSSFFQPHCRSDRCIVLLHHNHLRNIFVRWSHSAHGFPTLVSSLPTELNITLFHGATSSGCNRQRKLKTRRKKARLLHPPIWRKYGQFNRFHHLLLQSFR